MAKERAMAIFIGLIMIFSVGGFALNSAIRQTPRQQTFEIPTIVYRELSPEETIFVLQTGRVLIEDFYPENCSECLDKNLVLEDFANKLEGFVVLEEVIANETRLQMIGMGGKIVDLENETITESSLMDIFCDIAIAQPNECLLREI